MYDSFFKLIENEKNSDNASAMSAYMKNQFSFLGLKAPLRRELCKEPFKSFKVSKSLSWEFVYRCWEHEAREFQYIGVDYLLAMKCFLKLEDISKIEFLITSKSWWDSVDSLNQIVSYLIFSYPNLKELMLEWSIKDNIWLRRVAIIHQLLRKDDTDTSLLELVIKNNLGSREFFINKAIGWSLRDYSKFDPDWVRAFIHRYRRQLSPLSIRESSKYI